MAGKRTVAPQAEPPLVLKTLGGTALARPGGDASAPILGPGKPLALIVYLACSPEHTAARDHLCDLLWADLEPDAARHSLRQTVWYLRQRLGADALALDRDGRISLSVSLASDREAFLSAVEKGDPECAVAHYTGDFVPDYAAPGGAEFEQWADLERFRLRLLFLRAGEDVVRRFLAQARVHDAQLLARRLRDADRSRESGWRLLIEALLSSNDRLVAAVEAEALRRLLAAEDREPEPATRRLLETLAAAPAELAAPPDSSPRLVAELVGRGKEFSAVMEAWDGARGGTGRHLHIHGPAGIGKTRLLEDVLARLRAQGAQALLLRAKPGERQIEYAFASDLAAALCSQSGSAGISPNTAATLVALNPALSSRFAVQPDHAAGPEALRRRAIALCETLAAVADDHPLALLLDDLHWSDTASRRVLLVLLDRLPRHRVLVVTAARPGVEESVAEPGRTLFLEALSADDVRAFVASLSALPSTPWATRLPKLLHHATGGVPLLLLDSLEWLLQRELLQRSESGWACRDPQALEAELAGGSALRRRIADLERRPARLLLLLAEVGTPLPADRLARIASLPPTETEEGLATLELRGLARRRADEWEPAHDEIAAAAHGQASGEAIRAANAAVGTALAREAGDDASLLFKAGRHLAVAGEDASLPDVFRRWLLIARRQGERRPTRRLAAELLGNGDSGHRADALLRSLPLHVRAGLTSGRRMAVAAAGLFLITGAAAALRFRAAAPGPDATLVLSYQGTGDSLGAVAIPVRREGWEGSAPLDLAKAGRAYPTLAHAGNRGDPAPSPDGKRWVFPRLIPESAATKLFVIGADERAHEVTDSVRDDYAASWSPDGRSLVFSTERWNSNRWSDIATLDLASGRVRRLTSDPKSELSARWSPDGTRIGFLRQTGASDYSAICWTTPAGDPAVCLPVQATGLIGWYDSNQLLIRLDSAGRSVVTRYDLETHEQQVFWRGSRTDDIDVSDDGQWIACHCQPEGYDQPAWFVFPAERPDLARRLALGSFGAGHQLFAAWVGSRLPLYIARIEIRSTVDSISQASDFQLHVQGWDSAGEVVAVPLVTWHSSDTAVATVERGSGLVHPLRAGAVTIVATAGGWRHAQRRLTIVPPVLRPVFSEEWSDMNRWVSFGAPRPILTTGPQGVRAFLNNGDGWNKSGAHSRQTFPAHDGLGMEARLSTPVVGPRQQVVILALAAWVDSSALARMDSSVTNLPAPQTACSVAYPAETGDNPATRSDMEFGGRRFRLPARYRSGAWYRIALQLFPDGRCGVAVDGETVAIEEAALPLDLPYHVLLEGNSLANRMLVGPVEVWEGVRPGFDRSRTGFTGTPALSR